MVRAVWNSEPRVRCRVKSLRRTVHIGLGLPLLGLSSAALAQTPLPRIVVHPAGANAGDYKIDPHHASVTVKLSHMGMSFYALRFDGVEGHFAYDSSRPAWTQVSISIDPKSIDTGDRTFDQLISNRYFEVAKFPSISFTSTKIKSMGSHGVVEGVLDLHGVKKPVVLDVTYRGFTNTEGQPRMGFSGETTFKRSDFGVDAYVPLEGDEVNFLIEVEFIRASKL